MYRKNAYIWTGGGLLVGGSLVFLWSYFVYQVAWITTLGAALVTLGIICLALGRTIPQVSPEVSALLLETGLENINSMLEELGIRSRSVYLPGSLAGGKPQALIPLHSNPTLPQIKQTLPRRLIVRYGAKPDDIGLLVSTLGTTAISLLETVPGNTATELELALTRLFSGILGIADGARVTPQENHIQVEISHPRLEDKPGWSRECLGGPLASMTATLAAEAWNKPVTIRDEKSQRGKYYIDLEVLV